ncbi:MAG: hypothetical protein GX569_09295, partial [Candidatus Riflebacteria bacterium]|nr:hypothetical protein [Candidatus Riflebacteria bacterium]
MRRKFEFIRSVVLLICLVLVVNGAEALQQLTNTGFSTAGGDVGDDWTPDNQISAGYALRTLDRQNNGGNPNQRVLMDYDYSSWWGARSADGMLYQPFNTPAGPVNASLRFDYRRIRTNTPPFWRLTGEFRDSTTGASPNESTYFVAFEEEFTSTNYGTGAWIDTGWTQPQLLDANKEYRVRIYFYTTCSAAGRTAGVDIDNVLCNISPSGLTGDSDGTQNSFSWNTSTGAIGLHGAQPYRVYWGTTSGVYTDSSIATTTSFSHAAPAGAVVYYAVTDRDTDSVDSPHSVEWPIVRQTVRDGTGADVDTIIGNDIDMNWAHVAVTGFTRTGYQVALGSTPGSSDVAGWVDLAAGETSYTFTGVSLTSGNTYYTSVRMVTDRGTLNYSSSDGFVSVNLDVRDGSGADVDITSSLTDADLNWGPAPFAVGRYDVALGTTPGGTDIVGWTNVNLATSYSFTGLSLGNGGSYYCSVRAYDPGMSVIGVFSSDGFSPIIDTTLTVRDGSDLGVDTDDIFSLTAVGVNWDDSTGLPVLRYEAAIGTTPGGDDVIGWTDMGAATSGILSGSLATGTTYYSSVRMVHSTAGTLPSYSSDGFVCRKFEVRDGPGADIDYTFSADTLQANWDAVTVPFLRYEVAAGTTPGGTDVVGWTSAGTANDYTFSGLTLVGLPTMYYVSVRIIGTGGLPIAMSSSNGIYRIVVVDITVRDGLNPDIEFSFFENRAEMNWDHPSAGIIRYEVALGSSMFGDDVHSFTDVGHARQAALTGFSLASGTRYFATVRGISAVGEVEAFGGSNGFIACRDQVLTDTASQTYFHNARVLRMIDTAADPGSIRPKTFSFNGGGTRTWARHMSVDVTEPGVTARINAPCRVILNGLNSVVANAIRVADDQGNEIPRYVLTSTATSMDLVFLVNMAQGETKRYWVFWDNGAATNPGDYGFTDNATNLSFSQWTPYYSRKNMPSGNENVTLGAPLSNGDDVFVSPGNLAWPFYFFGTDFRAWRMNTNGYVCQNNVGGWRPQVSNRWNYFTSGNTDSGGNFGRLITPMWTDLWPGNGAPQYAGIYRNVFADRVAYTWYGNRFGESTDTYIFQAVLYKTSDIALRYSYLGTLGIIGPHGTYDREVNIVNTAGISNCDNTRWLTVTPLIIGIGKSPTSFLQCADAFRPGGGGNYTPGPPQGGAGWVEVAHIESMIFDSRTASPVWQRIEYDCTAPAGNQLVISTRSGSTPLPDMGGWTGWVPAATVTTSGDTALSSTDRYIQYRVGFERNNHAAAMATLEEVRFVHGGISIEEVRADTPDGVTQGQTGIPVEVTIRNFYTSPVDLTSLGLTFSLGSYAQTLVPPVGPGTQIPAGGTITATFTVDVAIDSPTGTATVDAFASATSGIYTFEDEDAQTPHEWWVRSRAQLSILKVETVPTFVNKGQADILVNMLIANLGETPYYFQGASLTFSLGDYEPQTGSLTTPLPIATDSVEIAPLSEFTAIFTVKVSATSDSGFVAVISGTASGTDKFSGLNTDDLTADITDSWTIQNPGSLVLEEVIASDTVYRGQTNTPVFLRVSNMGEATAIWEYSDLLVPPYFATGTYDACYSITPFSISLPGYMETTARYGIDISPTTATCTDSVNANIYGSDENTGGALKWDSGALLPATWTIRAEKLNTFKDPAYAFPSASFNRPTVGNITVYARGENVNPYAEYVFRWLDPSNNTVLVSPPLTADASGTMYHQFDIAPASPYGDYKVRITNPTNTIIAVENIFEVTSPAVLSGMFELPAQVSVGQPFVGSMTFVNTGGAKLESGYASPLDLNTALLASLDAGPAPAVIDVEGYNQATATYDFTAQAPGNFSASATVYGFDANDGTFLTSAAFLSNTCLIQTQPSLAVDSITAVPTIVYLNQKNLRVEVVIRNSGQATAVLEAASLTFAIGGYSQSIFSPAFPYELAGNNTTVTIIYDVSVNQDSPTGPDTITSNLLWHDKNWPENGGYLTGGPPQENWTINPIGIKLSANLTYDPLQDDFNRGQTIYIRCYGFAPLDSWFRVRLYDYEVPQAGNSPNDWENCSPQLAADDDGSVDHLYTFMVGDKLGTWTVLIDRGDESSGGPKQAIQYFRVQVPGNLVASLTISPTEVFVGEEFTVTMLASNTVANGSTISNASPSLLVPSAAAAGSATLISGPTPASATVAAGKTSQYIWTYRADSNTGLVGSYSLTVDPTYYAAGYDLNTTELVTSNKAVSNSLIIYSRDLALASATLDFGVMECGDTKMVGPTQIQNLGNYPFDFVKWITTDLNGPGMLKISKANLGMSPELIGGIAAGATRDATATLFIPYNKEANDYSAIMSIYQDLNGNNIFDFGELYDSFVVKVTVPPCKRVFAAQEIVDLGDWGIGKNTLIQPLNI